MNSHRPAGITKQVAVDDSAVDGLWMACAFKNRENYKDISWSLMGRAKFLWSGVFLKARHLQPTPKHKS